ncbi:hemolysin-III related-domain-containing protein [Bombardia bombarda]|uniref:Hemolysin-III related-domain-containing protein n=1 Tax=Bombardia bombarda TaxID=252184 RepID=A0AA40CFV7_9PEZI|nr:hemolysin-III related-domain-containing protein [Bombardia bombarda]
MMIDSTVISTKKRQTPTWRNPSSDVAGGFADLKHNDSRFAKEGKLRRAQPRAVRQAAEAVKERIELLLWSDVPHWQQHGSELIHTGYRGACGSIKGCLQSWTYLHNETVNIYSHIIGAIIFLLLVPAWLIATAVPPRFAVATPLDMLVLGTYLAGVGICFILSVTFHTLMSHSPRIYHLGMRLDFQGILLLMWSSTVPLVYYSFPCQATVMQTTYLVTITLLAGACSAATLLPRFSGPHLGHYRAVLFGSFGLGSFVVPIAHGILLYGLKEQSRRIGLGWIMVTGLCNGVGVVVYAVKVSSCGGVGGYPLELRSDADDWAMKQFPEKWFPKTFDIWGASHQCMHVMVVCAALAFARAMVAAFDFRHEHGVQC